MNPRKRSGDALYRPGKQPRISMRAPDGGHPSPGGNPNNHDRLRARWVAHFTTGLKNGWSFAQGTVELVVDTLFPPPSLPMYSITSTIAPAAPPLAVPPTSPSSTAGELIPIQSTPAIVPSKATSKAAPASGPLAFKLMSPPKIAPIMSSAAISGIRSVDSTNERLETTYLLNRSHKMHVQAAVAGAREELLKELYVLNQKNGYSSDFSTFKGFMKKQALIKRYMRSRSSSLTDLGRHPPRSNSEDDTDFLRRAIEKAQATLNGQAQTFAASHPIH
ncbi:hypothetical protein B0H17DRAFT_1192883 [Mycena rosella]|uniref:Uncharacterized protein n=1 Tax=Mycena rosella TaxID=1033263 RepID=A0AAD7GW75_MYCRO|nr:hypothetical protein B0H17DRAFT_1192883 [Mycena rosella]